MSEAAISVPLVPKDGWGVLHLFCRVTRSVDAEAVTAAVKSAEARGLQVVTFAVLGHKADVGFMILGPDLVAIRQTQSALASAGLELASSYVSLTEVSEYAKGMPRERLEPRLHPQLPPAGMRAFCFYPMTKRRERDDNWYRLGYDDRLALMHEHGATGRSFAGRVVQLVTGSTGLDDYEWGVSLFATAPDDLKQCVHTMRFDEVSARFAEFGPFYTGFIAPVEEVLRTCGLG
jgi:hydrogen peroxide-dependent heme synthase